MKAIAGLLLAGALARPVAADEWRGGGSLALDLRYAELEPETDQAARVVTAGPRARAAGGKGTLALAAGLDLQLGMTGGGEFAYQVNVLPLGAGLLVGRSARLGVVGGFGLSGITGGVLPLGFALPVEAFVDLSLGSKVRAAVWGRASPLLAAEERQDGAAHAPFGDELEAGFTLRWDRRRSDHGLSTGNGYHLGVTWGQQLGVDVLGFVLGYSLDASR